MNGDLLALLNKGVNEATNGSKSRARTYFRQALTVDRYNETALLWLAWLTDDAYEAVELLETVVARNPKHEVARAYLEQARARRSELDQLVAGSSTYNVWNKATVAQTHAVTHQMVMPFIGEFLLQRGFITQQQLEAGLHRHQELAKRGVPKLTGQVLVEMGYLTQSQLENGLQQHRREYNYSFRD